MHDGFGQQTKKGLVSMDFSIVVPVYNIEKYIEECICSLLDQQGITFEIILIDDGSTDRSRMICSRYAEEYPCIQAFKQKHRGASAARNAGVRHAAGSYILFADGDDTIKKNVLQEIQKEIVKEDYPDLIFLECKKIYYNSRDHMIREIPMKDGVTPAVRGLKRKQLLSYIAGLAKYPASPCTKAIKREMFLKHDLMFQEGLLCEDLEWAVRLFLAVQSAGYCPLDYYFYRQNRIGSCSSARSEKKAADMLFIAEKWIGSLKSCYGREEKQLIKSLMEYIFRFLVLNVNMLPRRKRAGYKHRVHACDSVLGEREDPASRMIRIIYKMFGIDITGVALRGYLLLRSKAETWRI